MKFAELQNLIDAQPYLDIFEIFQEPIPQSVFDKIQQFQKDNQAWHEKLEKLVHQK